MLAEPSEGLAKKGSAITPASATPSHRIGSLQPAGRQTLRSLQSVPSRKPKSDPRRKKGNRPVRFRFQNSFRQSLKITGLGHLFCSWLTQEGPDLITGFS